MNVLAISAHPDDVEILCAGTLAKYAKDENKVFIYHTCKGDKGGFDKTQEEIAKERRQESLKSAKIIGAISDGGYFEDGNVYINQDSKKNIVEIIRKTEADVIITHHPEDYHTDHMNTSRLVIESNYMSSIKHLKTNSTFLKKIPTVYFMETLAGLNFVPEYYVEITETFKTKLEMLKSHKSQIDFLKKHSNLNIIDMVEVIARYRGYQSGFKFSECFVRKTDWPIYSSVNVLP